MGTQEDRFLAAVPRRLSIGAPVALIGSGIGVEDDDSAVAIAIRNVHLVCLGIHLRQSSTGKTRYVVTVDLRPRHSNLEDQLALAREFQYLSVVFAVCGNPHEPLMVNANP